MQVAPGSQPGLEGGQGCEHDERVRHRRGPIPSARAGSRRTRVSRSSWRRSWRIPSCWAARRGDVKHVDNDAAAKAPAGNCPR